MNFEKKSMYFYIQNILFDKTPTIFGAFYYPKINYVNNQLINCKTNLLRRIEKYEKFKNDSKRK